MTAVERDFMYLDPELIFRDERQPRTVFDESSIVELADSIFEEGVLQNLVVRPKGDGDFILISGERRWRASKLVKGGFESGLVNEFRKVADLRVPVVVREHLAAEEILRLQLSENLKRQSMLPMEEARAFARLRDEFDLFNGSERLIAKFLGVDDSLVSRRLKLMRLPREYQDLLDSGELPMYAAEVALKVPDDLPAVEGSGGTSAVLDLLELARSARSKQEAQFLAERRYLRPMKEQGAWDSEAFSEEREAVFAEWCKQYLEPGQSPTDGFTVVSYSRSRELFAFDSEFLSLDDRGSFRLADVVPGVFDGLSAVGKRQQRRWGDLAVCYGAPLFVACDGQMRPRVLVDRELVRTAAIEGAGCPEDCVFEIVGVNDSSAVSTTAGGESAVGPRDSDLQKSSEASEREASERADDLRKRQAAWMMRECDRVCREREAAGVVPLPSLFWEANFVIHQMGANGFEGTDHPLLRLYEVWPSRTDEMLRFDRWPGCEPDEEGVVSLLGPEVESLIICGWLYMCLCEPTFTVRPDAEEGLELLRCDGWLEFMAVYGVELQWTGDDAK